MTITNIILFILALPTILKILTIAFFTTLGIIGVIQERFKQLWPSKS